MHKVNPAKNNNFNRIAGHHNNRLYLSFFYAIFGVKHGAMNKPAKFTIAKRLQSFVHAFNGLKLLFRDEHNAKIQLAATILAVVLGFVLNISTTEWLVILLCFALVVSLELINSAIESLCDFVCPQKDVRIKIIKDLAAGAVLWGAMIVFIIGVVIFVPKLWQIIV